MTLKYKRNIELRREIAYTAGGDPTRYGEEDPRRGLVKADLQRIATQLQPADDDTDIAALDLRGLYETICRFADAEYSPNAGNAWALNRAALKAIHRVLDARAPEETPTEVPA
jgi:hypothetical protein